MASSSSLRRSGAGPLPTASPECVLQPPGSRAGSDEQSAGGAACVRSWLPRGLELTLSDGLISGLRNGADGSIDRIQTTAPISPGSSGGGLFDQEGRLVGITTFQLKEGQNLNFALLASWMLELSSKQTDLIEQRKKQAEGKSPAGPPEASDYAQAGSKQNPAPPQLSFGSRGTTARGVRHLSDGVGLAGSRRPGEIKARGAILAASPLHDAQAACFEALRNFRVVLSALPVEQGQTQQTESDDYPALKHFQQDIEMRVGSFVSEQDYPRDAWERGWQGVTIVRVTIGQDGRLKSLAVVRSSRFAVLDERAVAKMRETPLPKVPDELTGREFSADVSFQIRAARALALGSGANSFGPMLGSAP